jgi:excisionase family DNA binding protein
MSPLSTQDVARLGGIHRATLERWIKEGRISKPQPLRYGKQVLRLWTERDIAELRKYKAVNYNKKPRRKKVGRTKTKKSKS